MVTFFLVTQNVTYSFESYPWLGFIEESAIGALKHMTSEITFPGTYSFIASRGTSGLEGLSLVINPIDSLILDTPDHVLQARFPLCQLD